MADANEKPSPCEAVAFDSHLINFAREHDAKLKCMQNACSQSTKEIFPHSTSAGFRYRDDPGRLPCIQNK